MIRLKEEFDAEISSIVENISGRLRMGFQYFRSSRLIPPLVSAFSEEYPHVEFSFVEDTVSRLESMLSDNTIDIFFCNAQRRSPNMSITLYIETPCCS